MTPLRMGASDAELLALIENVLGDSRGSVFRDSLGENLGPPSCRDVLHWRLIEASFGDFQYNRPRSICPYRWCTPSGHCGLVSRILQACDQVSHLGWSRDFTELGQHVGDDECGDTGQFCFTHPMSNRHLGILSTEFGRPLHGHRFQNVLIEQWPCPQWTRDSSVISPNRV